jgi:predicted MFS family arabinose efflux permease
VRHDHQADLPNTVGAATVPVETSGNSPAARRQLVVLAAVAGLGVANLYYAQPLAAMMADTFHVRASAIGFALMLSQIGYALGMLLLVPLGDGRERRSLMLITAAAASGVLLFVAGAPTYAAFAVGNLLLGFTSILPQLSVPFAVGLVPSAERGRAIGLVMGGLLAGILVSRTASGTVASSLGWRVTFVFAAAVMVATAIMLRVALPTQVPPQPLPYRSIMASLFGVVRTEPLLRRHAGIGALVFASFSVFWSTLAFHLATLGYGSRTAGLFGVIGVVGVTAAPIVGRLAGKVRPAFINGFGLISVTLGYFLFFIGAKSFIVLALGVVLLDLGMQSSHLTNQTIIFGLKEELRNRMNGVYMVSCFVGGALGTAVAALAWQHWGWSAVTGVGAAFALCGLLRLALK